jgi:hydrogenase/urease accessory protein HupE
MGHQIGLAEQVMQPVTVLQSLLALIAVGLLCRQQPKLVLNRALALTLGLGLTAGLAAEVYLTLSHGQLIFALALAALAGGLVAFAHPLPAYAIFLFVTALGVAIGANLSSESPDWADLTQTLVGAFLGTLGVLHFLTTLGMPSTDNLQQIGVRIIGSWILASATMVLALDAHNLIAGSLPAWLSPMPFPSQSSLGNSGA